MVGDGQILKAYSDSAGKITTESAIKRILVYQCYITKSVKVNFVKIPGNEIIHPKI